MPTKERSVVVRKLGERTLKKSQGVLQEAGLETSKFPEAVHIHSAAGDAFLFPTGVIVDWSDSQSITDVVVKTDVIIEQSNLQSVDEQYEYNYVKSAKQFRIEDDALYIQKGKKEVLLALSHALAQSVQLDYKELRLETLFGRVEEVARQLSVKGKVSMSGHKLRKLIGSILSLQHDISLYGVANEKPELLWEQPELTTYYMRMSAYLELSERFDIVAQKMSVIHDTLDVLRDEMNHKHSSVLEWIIIVLIAIEFAYFIFEGKL